MVDVQVHGAGLVGLAIASGLTAAGTNVRVVDPAGRFGGASGVSEGVVLGAHPEHPWRFESSLGHRVAGEIVAFIHASLSRTPGFVPVGVDVVCGSEERDDAVRSIEASARIGLRAEATATGYRLLDAGRASVVAPDIPVHAEAERAEIDVVATGSVPFDPWLDDKLMPVRWQVARVAGLVLERPRLSRQASVFADTGFIAGARWATEHLEVGETEPAPSPKVSAMLERLAKQDFDLAAGGHRAGIVAESCDGLPIIGPIPGRPRVVVCAGFGIAGLTYGHAAAAAVVDGILGRTGFPVPAALRTSRFR